MGLCPHHCPPEKAAAGGVGVLVALAGGVFLLGQIAAGPVAAELGVVLHALLVVLTWCGVVAGSVLAGYAGYRIVRWRRAVGHAGAAARRAMPGHTLRAVRPAPLELERPVSRVTGVTIQAADVNARQQR